MARLCSATATPCSLSNSRGRSHYPTPATAFPELQSSQISHRSLHRQECARYRSYSCEISVSVVRIESCEISHELSYSPMRMCQVRGSFGGDIGGPGVLRDLALPGLSSHRARTGQTEGQGWDKAKFPSGIIRKIGTIQRRFAPAQVR